MQRVSRIPLGAIFHGNMRPGSKRTVLTKLYMYSMFSSYCYRVPRAAFGGIARGHAMQVHMDMPRSSSSPQNNFLFIHTRCLNSTRRYVKNRTTASKGVHRGFHVVGKALGGRVCLGIQGFRGSVLLDAASRSLAYSGSYEIRSKRSLPLKMNTWRSYSGSHQHETPGFLSGSSFHEVGVDEAVHECLVKAGFERMSMVQKLSYASLRGGRNVVLAAETGSGKTLAYLVPLIENLRQSREPGTSDALFDEEVMVDCNKDNNGSMLVLCPNTVLCEQVIGVIQTIFEHSSKSDMGIKAAYVSAQHVTYDDSHEGFPDIVVTTPGALHSLLSGVGPLIGPEWTFEGLKDWARFVVLDEADMLLGGAYGKKIEYIMDELRGGDRQRAATRACEELGIDLDTYWTMPRHVRKAAQLQGGQGMLDAGAVEYLNDYENTEGLRNPDTWLRQYVFVGATMPTNGRETVGAKIAAEFPTAEWISGVQLHRSMKHVEFNWIEVDSSNLCEALYKVVEGDEDMMQGVGRMIIFTKDTKATKDISFRLQEYLENTAIILLPYHKGMSQSDREESLKMAKDNSIGQSTILICTDSTARGLDIPGISHVVHADFPASAVDFIHRSGRTGRAGNEGTVTSLISKECRDLAEAIRELMEQDDSIEGAFSRNRSFRKKFKKYGKFVPRGQ